jgi:chromate transporter
MERPSLADVAAVFARFGNFTFGGGSATIAVLREELVHQRRWLSLDATDLSFAVSRITPGTNLLAFNAAIGWIVRGWPGALVALVAGSVPCSAFAVALSACYVTWSQHALMRVFLQGALAAAVAVMFATGWTLIRPYYRDARGWRLALFVGGSFGASVFLGLKPLQILLLAAILGAALPVPEER